MRGPRQPWFSLKENRGSGAAPASTGTELAEHSSIVGTKFAGAACLAFDVSFRGAPALGSMVAVRPLRVSGAPQCEDVMCALRHVRDGLDVRNLVGDAGQPL